MDELYLHRSHHVPSCMSFAGKVSFGTIPELTKRRHYPHATNTSTNIKPMEVFFRCPLIAPSARMKYFAMTIKSLRINNLNAIYFEKFLYMYGTFSVRVYCFFCSF